MLTQTPKTPRMMIMSMAVTLIFFGSILYAQDLSNGLITHFQIGDAETRAAKYKIDLIVPPGTAGMAPKLSLVYNHGGNGLLGMGWSLSGLSSITRCPATLAKDGFVDGVDFDEKDRFCLDGQKLLAVKGDYGANWTEYQTGNESFTKIKSYGSVGGGPEYFKVWTESGLLYEYGKTTDSRIEASGKSNVLMWQLSRVTDSLGYFFSVHYHEDSQTGEHYPVRINFTGNGGAGIKSNSSVQFFYEDRDDVFRRYNNGSMATLSKRLKTIQMKSKGNIIRDYQLTYNLSQLTGRSRLIEVKEFGQSGATSLAEFQLNWADAEKQLRNSNPDLSGGHQHWSSENWDPNHRPHEIADVTGDGIADFISFQWDGLWVWESSGSGIVGTDANKKNGATLWSSENWDPNHRSHGIADMTGDGIADFISFQTDGIWVWESSGSGIVGVDSNKKNGATRWYSGNWDPSSRASKIADINADGMADIISFQWDGLWVLQSTGNGFAGVNAAQTDGAQRWSSENWDPSHRKHDLADMNGDGLVDFLSFQWDGLWVWESSGSGIAGADANKKNGATLWYSGNWDPSYRAHEIADVNGDGLADVLSFQWDGLWVLQSAGTGFAGVNAEKTDGAQRWYSGNWDPSYRAHEMADVNGDGLADVLSFQWDGLWVLQSNGTGIVGVNAAKTDGAQRWSSENWDPNHRPHGVADVNGDGKFDVISFQWDGLYVWEGFKGISDKMYSVTNVGAGRTVILDFKADNSRERINLKDFSQIQSFEDLIITQEGLSTVIDLGIGRTFELRNYNTSQLTSNDIVGAWSYSKTLNVYTVGNILDSVLGSVKAPQVLGKINHFVIDDFGTENPGNANLSRPWNVIDLTHFNISSVTLVDSNGSTTVDLGDGQFLEIRGVTPDQLNADKNFLTGTESRDQILSDIKSDWTDDDLVETHIFNVQDKVIHENGHPVYITRVSTIVLENNTIGKPSTDMNIYVIKNNRAERQVIENFNPDNQSQVIDVSSLDVKSYNDIMTVINGNDTRDIRVKPTPLTLGILGSNLRH